MRVNDHNKEIDRSKPLRQINNHLQTQAAVKSTPNFQKARFGNPLERTVPKFSPKRTGDPLGPARIQTPNPSQPAARTMKSFMDLPLETRRQLFFGPNYMPQKEPNTIVSKAGRVPAMATKTTPTKAPKRGAQTKRPMERASVAQEVIRGTGRTMKNIYGDSDGSPLDRFSAEQLNSLDRTKVPGLVDAVSGLIEDRRVHRSWQDSPTVSKTTVNREWMGTEYGSGSKGYVNPIQDNGTTTTTMPGRFAGESTTGGWYDPITGAEYRTKRGAILGRSEDRIDADISHRNAMEKQNSINQNNLATTRMNADARRYGADTNFAAHKYSADKSLEAAKYRGQNTGQNLKQASLTDAFGETVNGVFDQSTGKYQVDGMDFDKYKSIQEGVAGEDAAAIANTLLRVNNEIEFAKMLNMVPTEQHQAVRERYAKLVQDYGEQE